MDEREGEEGVHACIWHLVVSSFREFIQDCVMTGSQMQEQYVLSYYPPLDYCASDLVEKLRGQKRPQRVLGCCSS